MLQWYVLKNHRGTENTEEKTERMAWIDVLGKGET